MKKPLPEINVDSGVMVTTARSLVDVRSEIAERQTKEKQFKEQLSEEADKIREDQENAGNYIGIIRVTGEEIPPVRVEFRMKDGALEVGQEQTLDKLFKAARPMLFGREKLVTGVTDPAKLVEDLSKQGRNPWDFLEVSVKKGMDRVVSEWSDAVTAQEAFVPRGGFLAILNDVANTLTADAKSWLRKYLSKAISTVPVLGTRGKA